MKKKLSILERQNNMDTGILLSNIRDCNKIIKKYKESLYDEFKNTRTKNEIRQLNSSHLNKYNIISIFDSALTRIIGLNIDELHEDILIVQTYFFDVIEDIILNGFFHNNEKYIYFTSSAGQIRTKKTVFIKESVWNKYKNSITCGLTLDIINSKGGINVNKYLAYLALSNSATDEWLDFDINKSIVVDDFETLVRGTVDFIDDKTYSIKKIEMDIPICHTDGCGMILPKVSKKSFMTRLPWMKGLLTPFPYDIFINKLNKKYPDKNHAIIKDIYGKEYDILFS